MTVLLWVIAPVAATSLALVWVTWRSRPRRPADIYETLQDHERFKAAMEGGTRTGRRRHRPGAR